MNRIELLPKVEHFYYKSKTLQDSKLSLDTSSKLFASLDNLLFKIRNSFDKLNSRKRKDYQM